MGWISIKSVKNVFWKATDAVWGCTLSLATTTGTVACAVGGAGLAAAQMLDRAFGSDYFGSGSLSGDVNLSANIINTAFRLEGSVPLNIQVNQKGETAFSLTSVFNPPVLRTLSLYCIGVGTTLNVLGNNFKLRRKHQQDTHFYKEEFGTALQKLKAIDYVMNSAAALSHSITVMTFSYAFIRLVDVSTEELRHAWRITYPFNSNLHGNSTFYNGPLAYHSYPVGTELISRNFSFQIPTNWIMQLKADFKGLVNVTYGGNLFYKESHSVVVPSALALAVTVIVGTGAYQARNFFAWDVRKRSLKSVHNSQFTPVSESDDNRSAFIV